MDLADVEALLDRHDVNKVQVGGFDLDGVLRGKYVSHDKFLSAAKDGFGFCDVIFGWDCCDSLYEPQSPGAFTGWHTGFPDLLAHVDLDTLRPIPWEPRTALAIADFHQRDGEPLPFCPRQALKRTVARATDLGFAPKMAAEYEFFVFEETPTTLDAKGFRDLRPESPGMFCYSLLRAPARHALVHDLMDSLADFGVPVEGLHTETGPGAFEACIRYDDALTAADRAGLFKLAVKQIAARHGFAATFMAKWSSEMPGCGGHIHQSLADRSTGANRFAPESAGSRSSRWACSETALHYLAGQQRYLPEMMPLLCPTVNSYKRLVPGFWAPTTATWGVENRTNALRLIPGITPASARIETRLPGADANPHLAMAACLATGLQGIAERLEPTEPTVGNAYSGTTGSPAPALPRSLGEATALLRESRVAREWFGDTFVQHVCMTREFECREFERAVTDWELKRYFEVI